MRKGIFIALCFFFMFSSSLYAFTKWDRIALQGNLQVSNGNAYTGFGIVDYGRWFELGANFGGLVSKGDGQSKVFLPSAFGGFRHLLSRCDCTYFAWGLNYSSRLGQDNGRHIKSDYGVGPYISLEKWLSYNILLVGYINPYRYEHEVIKNGPRITSNQYFTSGGIAVSYVFDYLHKHLKGFYFGS